MGRRVVAGYFVLKVYTFAPRFRFLTVAPARFPLLLLLGQLGKKARLGGKRSASRAAHAAHTSFV